MKSFRPWQVVLMVAAVLVLAGSLWWSFRTTGPAAKLSRRVMMVDITTGELFEFSTKSKPAFPPEKNPDSGAYTLMPATDEDGQWRVSSRYLEELRGMVERKEVDRATLVVDLASGAFEANGEPRSAN